MSTSVQGELRQFLIQQVNIPQHEQTRAKQTVEQIKGALRQYHHQFPFNFGQIFHQGSFYEGLKVIAADEFDLAVPFTLNGNWIPSESVLPGYYRIDKQYSNEALSVDDMIDGGKLNPAGVRRCMQSTVQKAVNGINGMNINLSYSGPAITLDVDSRMSIDIVPCFQLNGRHFVAKSPKSQSGIYDNLWRESFSDREKEKINNMDRMNGCHRDCLKILKTIQKKRGSSQLGMLCSYHLKTCMLHLDDRAGLSWGNGNLADRFKDLVQLLMDYLENRNMPHYFRRSVNLLAQYNAASLEKLLGWLQNVTRTDQHIIDDLLHERGSDRPTQDNFDIFVKNQNGRTTIYQNMRKSTVVKQLKQKIQKNEGIPVDQQRLTYGSRQLEDGNTLGDYNIQKDSTLYLLGRLRGGDIEI